MTIDHTLVAELVHRRHITESRAARHPLRNVLSKCVGTRQRVKADIEDLAIRPGDWLILATDGLFNVLGKDRLEAVLIHEQDASAKGLCEVMMGEAMAAQPTDNVTVAAVHAMAADGGDRDS